jgi:glucose/arabinose dehydrogenase
MSPGKSWPMRLVEALRLARVLLTLAAVMVLVGPDAHSQPVDDPPGKRYRVRVADLPAPYATASIANGSSVVDPPPGHELQAPPGFRVDVFADGLDDARWMAVAPDGSVFLAEARASKVTLLRDADGDGKAEQKHVFVSGMARPHGLALHDGYLYIADLLGAWRVPYTPGDTEAAAPPQRVTPEGAFGERGGHWTRNIAFHPDGSRFYVAIGSRGNIAENPLPRATVQEFTLGADGRTGPGRTFASGLRNPVGIAFYPGTTDLYVVVNERDRMGDGLVPDYLARLVDGGFYGWPYSYLGANPQPGMADKRPDLVQAARLPEVLFQAHSAPLGLVFYDADQFPVTYRGNAFVALHGSWNAGTPTGYKVVRVPFADGRPADHYINFLTGFWVAGRNPALVMGRPVGLALATDGSLLVADDRGQRVWRVHYVGE